MNMPMENKFHTVRGYQLIKQNESRLTPALEDYLEMTYRLCLKRIIRALISFLRN